MNNYTSLVPAKEPLNKKPEFELEILKQFDIYKSHNHSVDDLYLLLHILFDLNEQMWAQTRSPLCSSEVKQLMNSVSRPQSAFNRLGSFVTWSLRDISPITASNNGFYYKESGGLSQF